MVLAEVEGEMEDGEDAVGGEIKEECGVKRDGGEKRDANG